VWVPHSRIGTLGGKFKRKQTGKANCDEAKAVAAIWEKVQHWDGEQNAALNVPRVDLPMVENARPESPAQSITIERAVQAFTSEFSEYAAPNTQKKYKLILGKLTAFSIGKGYVMLDQWEPIDVREFRSSWSVSPRRLRRT